MFFVLLCFGFLLLPAVTYINLTSSKSLYAVQFSFFLFFSLREIIKGIEKERKKMGMGPRLDLLYFYDNCDSFGRKEPERRSVAI